MDKDLVMWGCALCQNNLYFESYAGATEHLGIKHSTQLKSKLTKRERGREKEQQGPPPQLLITPVNFPQLRLHLKRLSPPIPKDEKVLKLSQKEPGVGQIKKRPRMKHPPPPKNELEEVELPAPSVSALPRQKGRGRRRHPGGSGSEIKLETLKASEIETLMSDLFQTSSTCKSAADMQEEQHQQVRKSRRSLKTRFKTNYGELDSEDEEIIRVGSGRGTKPHKKKKTDDDQDLTYSTHKSFQAIGKKKFQPSSGIKVTARGRIKRKVKSEPGESELQAKRVGEKPLKATFRCRLCDIEFSCPGPYLQHMKESHLNEKGGYTCAQCNTDHFPLKKFNRHLLRHTRPQSILNNAPNSNDPEYPFKCDSCGKRFRWPSTLKFHAKIHEGKEGGVKVPKSVTELWKPWVCPVCQSRFNHRNNLQRHFTIHLENNPFQCKFSNCGKRFNSDFNLRRHVLLHTSRVRSQCPLCPAVFSRNDHLTRHLKRFHPGGAPISEEDLLKLRPRRYRVQDINDLAPDQLFPPPPSTSEEVKKEEEEERRVEAESVHLTDTILVKEEEGELHLDGKSLVPQQRRARCPSPVGDITQLEGEGEGKEKDVGVVPDGPLSSTLRLQEIIMSDPVVRKIQEENPELARTVCYPLYNRNGSLSEFKCDMCSWSCSRAFLLQRHKQTFHNVSMSLFPTTDPQSSSMSTSQSSQGVDLFCGMCGYPSKSADELSTHMSSVHVLGERKLPCGQCGIRFATQTRLDRHLNEVHGGEKKWPCDLCTAKYSSSLGLRKHKREKHDEEYMKKNKFHCSKCGKTLGSKKSWEVHKELHTGSRPLSTCQLCGQTCAGRHSLKRHIQYVHLKVTNPWNILRRKERQRRKQKWAAQQQANGQSQVSPNTGDEEEAEAGSMEQQVDTTPTTQTPPPLNRNSQCSEILGF